MTRVFEHPIDDLRLSWDADRGKHVSISFPRDKNGTVGLQLIPHGMKAVPHRYDLSGLPEIEAIKEIPPRALSIDSLVQIKLVGDPYPGAFAQGRTMRNSGSVGRFSYRDAEKIGNTTTTRLATKESLVLEHRMTGIDGVFEVESTLRNDSDAAVTVEMLSSFSLGGLSPFDESDSTGRLVVHRFRTCWSAEARLESSTVEALHLERSWSGAGAFSERFGQVGSMPVRGWFPFIAVEDVMAGVVWGAQLAWAGSWQIEIYRKDDQLAISGGLADREFGHWSKTVGPGESITTPPAILACVRGSLAELCDRLTSAGQRHVDQQPQVEQDLPIVFNEWCTTWGNPSHQSIALIAKKLEGTPTRYLVIDAGWYKHGDGNWNNSHGDWIPSRQLFADGLAAVAREIRSRGLIPGLWFELETVGANSTSFLLADHLLKRDGVPIEVRDRRFWDLNDPLAIDFLSEKVIGLLEDGEFGYLKVDYNETIGIGCESPDSLGEGLRKQILAVYRFFDLIRARLPHLVIENCSSGGHRLEPSMMRRTAMSSFSDAHETVEIPIIAANLHLLALPRQLQIWAVLHAQDDDARLVYSLAATFLGRMCLSGDLLELSDHQWKLVLESQRLYEKVAPIIKNGVSRRFGNTGESMRHPIGWQGVLRVAENGTTALAVIHGFSGSNVLIDLPLPPGGWAVLDSFPREAKRFRVVEQRLLIELGGDFRAQVIYLERGEAAFR
jgi:alpha-galactosidase